MPLPTTNATITIYRLSSSDHTFSSVATGVSVYINQLIEDVVSGFDGQGSFFNYRMMTDGTHETIVVGDRVSDGTYTYDVKGKSVHSSLVGTHHQYTLTRPNP